MMSYFKLMIKQKSQPISSFVAAGILAVISSFGSGINTPMLAQAFSQEEVANYARAGFQQEMLRQKVYQQIKAKVNQPPPNITCDRPETMRNIDPSIRGIVNNYCNRSNQIIRQNNLSIRRFNQLKNRYDRGGNFFQQVQQQLLNMQNR